MGKNLAQEGLGSKEWKTLSKFMKIFFVGQLLGLTTLNSILTYLGISNNGLQISYKLLRKKISNKLIIKIFEILFEKQISQKMQEMQIKHRSNFSRELVTVVLDDSVFRQWLDSLKAEKNYMGYYGKFFSGQYGRVLYGLKVVTLGLSIDNVFYPLYLGMVKKYLKTDKEQPENAINVACNLVRKWGTFIKRNNLNLLKTNNLHFSCDNGYNNIKLSNSCKENGLIFVSVPKKTEKVVIEKQEIKLKDLIEQRFISKEKSHQEKSEKPFIMRIRAVYLAHQKEVVLLLFRLNNSKKVSVIYCTDVCIFSKTLRRHWFQRTYIEQFFRLLKHSMKIQQSNSRNKAMFEEKLLCFFFIALHIQKMLRFCKKNQPKNFKKYGFETLQKTCRRDSSFTDLLQGFAS